MDSSTISQQKIKFDLSKQINEINKRKLAKDKTFNYAENKRPALKIEVVDEYL